MTPPPPGEAVPEVVRVENYHPLSAPGNKYQGGKLFLLLLLGLLGVMLFAVPAATEAQVDPFKCGGKKATIAGLWRGNDVLTGTPSDDVIVGLGGNDTIHGDGAAAGGNDRLYGGDGSDTMNGNDGSDWMDGGPGTDSCQGGGQRDTFRNCP